MKGGLAIRTRLAIVSATLAVGVLAAGLLTVYLIDRRQVDQSLAADARGAAPRSRRVGRQRTPDRRAPTKRRSPTESDDRLVTAYLQARAGRRPAPRQRPARRAARARTASSPQRLWLAARYAARARAKRIEIAGEDYVVAGGPPDGARFARRRPAAEAEAGVRTLLDAMLIVCLVGLVPATGAAWLVTRRALAPLSRIAQRASRVTAGDLSVRMGPVRSHDEIADVAIAIDAMLDRLEGAFAAQRRFVHDASHELRTPLTIARGHLETALVPGRPPGRARRRRSQSRSPSSTGWDGWSRAFCGWRAPAPTSRPTREPVDVGELARRVVDAVARARRPGLERGRRAERDRSTATATPSSRCS